MSHSVWPHRPQPTRLPRPWDSPGKNTGVGCHFLLQCMKVKSQSEVAQSSPTLRDPKDCSLLGSSVHGIFQARVLEWGAIAFSRSGVLDSRYSFPSWVPSRLTSSFIKTLHFTSYLSCDLIEYPYERNLITIWKRSRALYSFKLFLQWIKSLLLKIYSCMAYSMPGSVVNIIASIHWDTHKHTCLQQLLPIFLFYVYI